jgi:hypothetical protein
LRFRGDHQEVIVADTALKGMFASVAKDSRLIPGVHHYCDEWCARCSVSDRCLAFRGVAVYRKAMRRSAADPTFRNVPEAIEFSREIAAAEGTRIPELDTIAAGGRLPRLQTPDPIVERAWEYALGVSLWLVFTSEDLRRFARSAVAPPEEVVLWHHLRIYLKLVRALIARERAHTAPGLADDANGCARLTLVSVQKSRQALMQIKRRNAPPPQATALLPLLEEIETGIDRRFPHARAFIRVGLDAPAA